jgi:CBS domain-containing protein
MPTEKTARWSTIFFDFETLYGDDRLTGALRNHLFRELQQKPRLLKMMVEDDATGGPALGLFNRLITASDKKRRGKIDLKRNGTRILADVARVYALSEGIAATNTGDRLSALVRQGRLDSDFVESVLAAYDELLDLTLGHQLRQLENGEPLDKLLKPDELTPIEEESLRMAMRIVKHLQGRMQGEFGTVML